MNNVDKDTYKVTVYEAFSIYNWNTDNEKRRNSKMSIQYSGSMESSNNGFIGCGGNIDENCLREAVIPVEMGWKNGVSLITILNEMQACKKQLIHLCIGCFWCARHEL